MKDFRIITACIFTLSCLISVAQEPPYPMSQQIAGMNIDWSTHQRHAPGSDNFQLTWADDGHQYGIWGDGGGFAGTNSNFRVSFGVARIEGDWDDYIGYDRSGHKESAENEANLTGKSWAIICIKGVLYAWIHPDKVGGWGSWDDLFSESKLYASVDKAISWKPAEWAFTPEDDLIGGAILQYGKNYKGAPDNYVYHYLVQPNILNNDAGRATSIQIPGKIFLLRVHKKMMMKRNAYEFFAGIEGETPVWSQDVKDKKPVFVDKNGIGTPMGISYNPGLKRYLLSTQHSKPTAGLIGIFDAPNPWGPWSTVTYATSETWFGHDNSDIVPENCFFWCFPTKWLSEDGRSANMVFTGGGLGKNNDSFNTVRVRFSTF